MIAALPMYDRPESAAANDRLWAAIRQQLHLLWRDGPDRGWPLPEGLTRPQDLWAHWTDPELAFSQTCGLPYRKRLHGRVTMIGTPDYRLPGCPPGHYNSVFVIRGDDPRDDPGEWPGMRLACNSVNSQSGWAAPQNHMAGLGLRFDTVVLTGAHRASAQAVAADLADIACIDAQTWRMIQRWDAVADRLREVGRSDPTPGLPLITAGGRDAAGAHAAAAAAIAALSDRDRAALDLHGLTTLSAQAYLDVPSPPFPKATATKLGETTD